ncbi:hypothetical protein T12_10723 [Trichinella patagoniensis]|uniref:Uncharacterized protein n=1 Tax=Trichinella patagoniensis TaxID=990121 RepID=A0A0V1A306_9BILA|nr:hypothetical protein T12_10723 [Trichinella patagoniensis]
MTKQQRDRRPRPELHDVEMPQKRKIDLSIAAVFNENPPWLTSLQSALFGAATNPRSPRA